MNNIQLNITMFNFIIRNTCFTNDKNDAKKSAYKWNISTSLRENSEESKQDRKVRRPNIREKVE